MNDDKDDFCDVSSPNQFRYLLLSDLMASAVLYVSGECTPGNPFHDACDSNNNQAVNDFLDKAHLYFVADNEDNVRFVASQPDCRLRPAEKQAVLDVLNGRAPAQTVFMEQIYMLLMSIRRSPDLMSQLSEAGATFAQAVLSCNPESAVQTGVELFEDMRSKRLATHPDDISAVVARPTPDFAQTIYEMVLTPEDSLPGMLRAEQISSIVTECLIRIGNKTDEGQSIEQAIDEAVAEVAQIVGLDEEIVREIVISASASDDEQDEDEEEGEEGEEEEQD